MTTPLHPAFEPEAAASPSFVPYTRFPDVERFLEEHLGQQSKAQLPPQHRETFVRALPWINAVFLPFYATGVLFLLGVSALSALFGHPFALLGALLSIGCFTIALIALPGLFSRSRRGWEFYSYARGLGLLLSVLDFSLIGALFGLVGLWLAFQVKYEYR